MDIKNPNFTEVLVIVDSPYELDPFRPVSCKDNLFSTKEKFLKYGKLRSPEASSDNNSIF